MRVALRDRNSEKVGSANQFIEVPNLKKERLTLSGIILENLTPAQWQKLRDRRADGKSRRKSAGRYVFTPLPARNGFALRLRNL